MRKLVLSAAILFLANDVFAGDGEIRRAGKPVPNQYIVVLNEGAGVPDIPTVASEIAREHDGKLRLVFRNVFEGFSVEMAEVRARAMSRDPRVLFVEENSHLEVSATQSLPPNGAAWHIDRIDQFDPYPDYQFTYATSGAGVKAYVIDTGVMASHQEFRTTREGVAMSRVVRGYDATPGDGQTASNPCNPALTGTWYVHNCSHGTAVAAVLGGRDPGVAKSVTIVPIRVLRFDKDGNGIGTAEDLIEGIDSGVLPDHSNYPGPAVANMSVSKSWTDPSAWAVDLAVNRMIDAGITVVAAAGNQNADACTQFTTSRLAYGNGGRVISVGGSMLSNGRDSRWYGNHSPGDICAPYSVGSNYGRCVDIFAPAHKISSALGTSSTGYREVCNTGTSYASPMVAGVTALHLQNATTASPGSVWNTIRSNATSGKLAGGTYPLSPDAANPSPDRLLYSNWFTQVPSYEGYLDVVNCRSIHGWAWDRNQPNSPINVDVYAGTPSVPTLLKTLWASSYRADLVSAGKGNGYHGYGIAPPDWLRNGQYHTIRVKYAGTDTNLFAAPKSLICKARIFTTQVPAENLPTGGLATLATQFSSTRSGYITELGFYRAPGETGTNTLRLWTDSGAELANKDAACTSAGWCWVPIPSVAITAGTRYRVSVSVNTYHSKTGCGIGSGITNDPLTAHSGFWIAGNSFPTGGSCSNFFVDVKFDM